MKKSLTAVALAIGVFGFEAWADSGALDLAGRAQLRQHAAATAASTAPLSHHAAMIKGTEARIEAAANSTTLAFLTLNEDADLSFIDNCPEVTLLSQRGGVALVKLPYTECERFAALPQVRSLRLQKPVAPSLRQARATGGVDLIHSAPEESQLQRAYTGKGVVAGIVDAGIDPNHANFLDENGENRILFLSYLRMNASGTGMAETFYGEVKDADPVSAFVTDDASQYHGTHTLGILGGSYKGEMEMAETDNNGTTAHIRKGAGEYYGVAPDAHLAVSCGTLADGFVAYGMEYIYGFASEYMQMPLVFSLSLGSNTGSHDPSTSMSRFLDAVGEEAIVCVAAGNEGDHQIALAKNLTAADNTVSTLIHPYAYQYDPAGGDDYTNNTIRYGAVSVYSSDNTPFELQAVIFSKSRGYRVVKRLTATDGTATYYCSSADWQQDDSDVVGDTQFKRAFDGYVGVGMQLDSETNRYYGLIDYYVTDTEENRNNDGEYVLGFIVTGRDGQRIDCYCDGLTTELTNYGLDKFDNGSRNGSISDLAVGRNIITVGSYNTADRYASLDGGVSVYQGDYFKPGLVSGFSSFGTLADGRNLPTVCAPGSTVISSVSGPYINYITNGATAAQAEEFSRYLCSAKAEVNGSTHWWKQEIGTSMSTPFVAGGIALWLEADPNLTTDDVKDIIATTSIKDADVAQGDPVQWGAGKFDALAGLKEVLRRAAGGVGSVAVDNDRNRLIVTSAGNAHYNLFLAGAEELAVEVYNLSGTRVVSAELPGCEGNLSLEQLPAGIYMLGVNGLPAEKIVVK